MKLKQLIEGNKGHTVEFATATEELAWLHTYRKTLDHKQNVYYLRMTAATLYDKFPGNVSTLPQAGFVEVGDRTQFLLGTLYVRETCQDVIKYIRAGMDKLLRTRSSQVQLDKAIKNVTNKVHEEKLIELRARIAARKANKP